jgi:hypothetical membrane protein
MYHPLSAVALAGPALFVLCATVLSAITPKYSWPHNTISELALRKYSRIHMANYLLNGGLILILGLLCVLADAALYPSIAISIIGVVIVLSGFFKTDPIDQRKLTPEGYVHNLLFLVGMIAIIIAQFMQVDSSTYGRFSLFGAIVSVLGLGYTMFGRHYRGLFQRVLVVTFMTWITVFASLTLT